MQQKLTRQCKSTILQYSLINKEVAKEQTNDQRTQSQRI